MPDDDIQLTGSPEGVRALRGIGFGLAFTALSVLVFGGGPYLLLVVT